MPLLRFCSSFVAQRLNKSLYDSVAEVSQDTQERRLSPIRHGGNAHWSQQEGEDGDTVLNCCYNVMTVFFLQKELLMHFHKVHKQEPR